MRVNRNYANLEDNYLFATVSSKVAEFKEANPDKKMIYMGIGDVTKPLCDEVINELKSAVKRYK